MSPTDKENVIKMQKLRRTLDRLRNMRSSERDKSPAQKRSWLARLRERLGLGKPQETAES